MRYFVVFSYFGEAYHGWQRQPNAVTIQQLMEEIFSTVLRQPIALVGAGRTDTGVHAREMVAHFDCASLKGETDLEYRLNSFLPDDIAIKALFEVPAEAHARFHALDRTYEYWLVQEKDPFNAHTAHYIRIPLNLEAMNEAAELLLQYSNFECFSKSNSDVKTFICDIKKAAWTRVGSRLVFTITADRFLRNMVRAIVGTLLEVGQGKRTIQDVKLIIKSRDRAQAGVSVPAKGLYLTKVSYPEHIVPNTWS